MQLAVEAQLLPDCRPCGPREANPRVTRREALPDLSAGRLGRQPRGADWLSGDQPGSPQETRIRQQRAEVTIKFFELRPEDDGREELGRERTHVLIALDTALRILELDPPQAQRKTALGDIDRLQRSSSPHASCVRSALALYKKQSQVACRLFDAARNYLDSESP